VPVGLTAAAPDIGCFFIFRSSTVLGKEIVTNEDEKHRSHNQRAAEERFPAAAWRRETSDVSLPEVHGSIAVPKHFGFWRKLLAFSGPGYLVAVGYMDRAIGDRLAGDRSSATRS